MPQTAEKNTGAVSVLANGSRATSDDPLQNAVISLVAVMKADFGERFKRTFESDEELRQFKRRLYIKLRGMPHDAIVPGYEAVVAKKPGFIPTIPEIAESVADQARISRRKSASEAEIAAITRLPKPDYIGLEKIAQMRAEARKRIDERGPLTPEEQDAQIKAHEALLDAARSQGKVRVILHRYGQCAVEHCTNPGTQSRSLDGSTHFFCREHYRESGMVRF